MSDYLFTSHLYLGFKRIDDSTKTLTESLAKIGRLILTDDKYPILEAQLNEAQRKDYFAALVGSQIVQAIEVLFDGDLGRINIHYYHDIDDQDLQDLSIIESVPIKAKDVEFRFLSDDVRHAQNMGFDKLEKLSVPYIRYSLARAEPEPFVDEKPKDNGIEVVEKVDGKDILDLFED